MRFHPAFHHSKQTIATILSLSLLWTSGNWAAAAGPAPLELNPPSHLGMVVDAYPTSTSKPQVILIQDLHAHYGVQKNIAGILDFLAKKLAPSVSPAPSSPSLPYALAVEGASGPVDSSILALFPDQKIKQGAAEFLMREGELTGAEYFAAMHSLPNALVGVEDLSYYTMHRDLFRKTLADREALVSQLKQMQSDIALLRRHHRRDVSMADLELVDKDLGLLVRVADLQATEREVREFGPRLNQFMALAEALLRDEGREKRDERENSSQRTSGSTLPSSPVPPLSSLALRQLISSSIDYYVMALMRNKPMVDNTLALLRDERRRDRDERENSSQKTSGSTTPSSLFTRPSSLRVAVLVAGGFHTAPITQLLRAKNISYLVITPAVDKITDADHALYVKRLSGQLLTEEEILAQANDRHSELAKIVRKDNATTLAKLLHVEDKSLAVGINIARPAVIFAALLAAGALLHHLSLSDYWPHFTQLLSHYIGPAHQVAQDWLMQAPTAMAAAIPSIALRNIHLNNGRQPSVTELFQQLNGALNRKPVDFATAQAALSALEERENELDQYDITNLRFAKKRLQNALVYRSSLTELKAGAPSNANQPDTDLNIFMKALDSPNPAMRLWAMARLRSQKRNAHPAVNKLIQLYDGNTAEEIARESNNAMRLFIIQILGEIGGLEAINALERIVQAESDLRAKKMAIKALYQAIANKALQYNVVFSVNREVTPRTLKAAKAALDAIYDAKDLLAKTRESVRFEITKIEDETTFGQAVVGVTAGAAEMAVSQHEKKFGNNEELLAAQRRKTATHELLHKLSTMVNKDGTDLVFPIADWIALLQLHGYNQINVGGRFIPIEEYLRGDLDVVKRRIRGLRGKDAPPLIQVYRWSLQDEDDVYHANPHEIVAWNGVQEKPRAFGGLNVDPEKTLEILQRSLLRANDQVYRYDLPRGRWIKTPAPPQSGEARPEGGPPAAEKKTPPYAQASPAVIGLFFGIPGMLIGLGIILWVYRVPLLALLKDIRALFSGQKTQPGDSFDGSVAPATPDGGVNQFTPPLPPSPALPSDRQLFNPYIPRELEVLQAAERENAPISHTEIADLLRKAIAERAEQENRVQGILHAEERNRVLREIENLSREIGLLEKRLEEKPILRSEFVPLILIGVVGGLIGWAVYHGIRPSDANPEGVGQVLGAFLWPAWVGSLARSIQTWWKGEETIAANLNPDYAKGLPEISRNPAQPPTAKPSAAPPANIEEMAPGDEVLDVVDLDKDYVRGSENFNATQSTIYRNDKEHSVVKVFKLPGVTDAHVRKLVEINQQLRQALGTSEESVVTLVPMGLVRLAHGGLGIRMPLIQGSDLPDVLGRMDPEGNGQETGRLRNAALAFLDQVDQMTGGLADRKEGFGHSGNGDDIYANFIVHEKYLAGNRIKREFYTQTRLVNVDPINMATLMQRMAAPTVSPALRFELHKSGARPPDSVADDSAHRSPEPVEGPPADNDLNIADIGLEAGPHDPLNQELDKYRREGRWQHRGTRYGVKIWEIKDVRAFRDGQRGHAGITRDQVFIAEGARDVLDHEISELKLWQQEALHLAEMDPNTDWQTLTEVENRNLAVRLRAYLASLSKPEREDLQRSIHDRATLFKEELLVDPGRRDAEAALASLPEKWRTEISTRYGAVEYLAQGSYAWVFVTGDKRKVIKIPKPIKFGRKLLDDQATALLVYAQREVETVKALRRNGLQEVTETELLNPESYVLVEDFVSDGMTFEELDGDVQTRVKNVKIPEFLKNRARPVLKEITFDSGKGNFRYTKQGDIIHWLDRTTPPESVFSAADPERVVRWEDPFGGPAIPAPAAPGPDADLFNRAFKNFMHTSGSILILMSFGLTLQQIGRVQKKDPKKLDSHRMSRIYVELNERFKQLKYYDWMPPAAGEPIDIPPDLRYLDQLKTDELRRFWELSEEDPAFRASWATRLQTAPNAPSVHDFESIILQRLGRQKRLPPVGGGTQSMGFHPLAEEEITPEQAAVLAENVEKDRSDEAEKLTMQQRREWAVEFNRVLTDPSDPRAKIIFSRFPFLKADVADAQQMIREDRIVRVDGKPYEFEIIVVPRNSAPFTADVDGKKISARAFIDVKEAANGEPATLTLYVHGASTLLLEVLKQITFAHSGRFRKPLRPNARLGAISPYKGRRHTYALFAMALLDGEIFDAVVDGEHVPVVIPQELLADLREMPPLKRKAFLENTETAQKWIREQKFPKDPPARIYGVAMADALYKWGKALGPSGQTPEPEPEASPSDSGQSVLPFPSNGGSNADITAPPSKTPRGELIEMPPAKSKVPLLQQTPEVAALFNAWFQGAAQSQQPFKFLYVPNGTKPKKEVPFGKISPSTLEQAARDVQDKYEAFLDVQLDLERPFIGSGLSGKDIDRYIAETPTYAKAQNALQAARQHYDTLANAVSVYQHRQRPPLAHPDTYKAAKIRLRLGRWAYLQWVLSAERAALEETGPYKQTLSKPLSDEDLQWMYHKFDPWYLPELWNILTRPIEFAHEHRNYTPDYAQGTDDFAMQSEIQETIRVENALRMQRWIGDAVFFSIICLLAILYLPLATHLQLSLLEWTLQDASLLIAAVMAPVSMHAYQKKVYHSNPVRLVDHAYLAGTPPTPAGPEAIANALPTILDGDILIWRSFGIGREYVGNIYKLNKNTILSRETNARNALRRELKRQGLEWAKPGGFAPPDWIPSSPMLLRLVNSLGKPVITNASLLAFWKLKDTWRISKRQPARMKDRVFPFEDVVAWVGEEINRRGLKIDVSSPGGEGLLATPNSYHYWSAIDEGKDVATAVKEGRAGLWKEIVTLSALMIGAAYLPLALALAAGAFLLISFWWYFHVRPHQRSLISPWYRLPPHSLGQLAFFLAYLIPMLFHHAPELHAIHYLVGAMFFPAAAHYLYDREQLTSARFKSEASRDSLTGLLNRGTFNNDLARSIYMAERGQIKGFSVLMLDADDFKQVNEVFGHLNGDKVLQFISTTVRNAARRPTDLVTQGRADHTGEPEDRGAEAFRFGGEELVVLLEGTDSDGAAIVAERIRKAVETQISTVIGADEFRQAQSSHPNVKDRSITISIGVSTYVQGDTASSIFKRANLAEKQAKNNGKNQFSAAPAPAESAAQAPAARRKTRITDPGAGMSRLSGVLLVTVMVALLAVGAQSFLQKLNAENLAATARQEATSSEAPRSYAEQSKDYQSYQLEGRLHHPHPDVNEIPMQYENYLRDQNVRVQRGLRLLFDIEPSAFQHLADNHIRIEIVTEENLGPNIAGKAGSHDMQIMLPNEEEHDLETADFLTAKFIEHEGKHIADTPKSWWGRYWNNWKYVWGSNAFAVQEELVAFDAEDHMAQLYNQKYRTHYIANLGTRLRREDVNDPRVGRILAGYSQGYLWFSMGWILIHLFGLGLLGALIRLVRERWQKFISESSARNLGMVALPFLQISSIQAGHHLSMQSGLPSPTSLVVAVLIGLIYVYVQSRRARSDRLQNVEQLIPNAAHKIAHPEWSTPKLAYLGNFFHSLARPQRADKEADAVRENILSAA